jgi:hypothetical protein
MFNNIERGEETSTALGVFPRHRPARNAGKPARLANYETVQIGIGVKRARAGSERAAVSLR